MKRSREPLGFEIVKLEGLTCIPNSRFVVLCRFPRALHFAVTGEQNVRVFLFTAPSFAQTLPATVPPLLYLGVLDIVDNFVPAATAPMQAATGTIVAATTVVSVVVQTASGPGLALVAILRSPCASTADELGTTIIWAIFSPFSSLGPLFEIFFNALLVFVVCLVHYVVLLLARLVLTLLRRRRELNKLGIDVDLVPQGSHRGSWWDRLFEHCCVGIKPFFGMMRFPQVCIGVSHWLFVSSCAATFSLFRQSNRRDVGIATLSVVTLVVFLVVHIVWIWWVSEAEYVRDPLNAKYSDFEDSGDSHGATLTKADENRLSRRHMEVRFFIVRSCLIYGEGYWQPKLLRNMYGVVFDYVRGPRRLWAVYILVFEFVLCAIAYLPGDCLLRWYFAFVWCVLVAATVGVAQPYRHPTMHKIDVLVLLFIGLVCLCLGCMVTNPTDELALLKLSCECVVLILLVIRLMLQLYIVVVEWLAYRRIFGVENYDQLVADQDAEFYSVDMSSVTHPVVARHQTAAAPLPTQVPRGPTTLQDLMSTNELLDKAPGLLHSAPRNEVDAVPMDRVVRRDIPTEDGATNGFALLDLVDIVTLPVQEMRATHLSGTVPGDTSVTMVGAHSRERLATAPRGVRPSAANYGDNRTVSDQLLGNSLHNGSMTQNDSRPATTDGDALEAAGRHDVEVSGNHMDGHRSRSHTLRIRQPVAPSSDMKDICHLQDRRPTRDAHGTGGRSMFIVGGPLLGESMTTVARPKGSHVASLVGNVHDDRRPTRDCIEGAPQLLNLPTPLASVNILDRKLVSRGKVEHGDHLSRAGGTLLGSSRVIVTAGHNVADVITENVNDQDTRSISRGNGDSFRSVALLGSSPVIVSAGHSLADGGPVDNVNDQVARPVSRGNGGNLYPGAHILELPNLPMSAGATHSVNAQGMKLLSVPVSNVEHGGHVSRAGGTLLGSSRVIVTAGHNVADVITDNVNDQDTRPIPRGNGDSFRSVALLGSSPIIVAAGHSLTDGGFIENVNDQVERSVSRGNGDNFNSVSPILTTPADGTSVDAKNIRPRIQPDRLMDDSSHVPAIRKHAAAFVAFGRHEGVKLMVDEDGVVVDVAHDFDVVTAGKTVSGDVAFHATESAVRAPSDNVGRPVDEEQDDASAWHPPVPHQEVPPQSSRGAHHGYFDPPHVTLRRASSVTDPRHEPSPETSAHTHPHEVVRQRSINWHALMPRDAVQPSGVDVAGTVTVPTPIFPPVTHIEHESLPPRPQGPSLGKRVVAPTPLAKSLHSSDFNVGVLLPSFGTLSVAVPQSMIPPTGLRPAMPVVAHRLLALSTDAALLHQLRNGSKKKSVKRTPYTPQFSTHNEDGLKGKVSCSFKHKGYNM